MACGTRRAPEKFQQKLVILGFDGMDPKLVQKWMDEGKLPNMQKLAKRGSGVRPLTTTHSPESPTAWASFATGVNAGKHNIYDFLVRDTTTYLPDLGMVTREPPRFLLNYIPISKPKITSIRGGTSFWVTAGNAGVRSSMLTVPVTYPPEDVPNGEMLSGLPLPDIRGTMGTFYYFGTDLSRYEEGNTEFGGILKRLVFDGDVAQTELVGPPNPIVRQQLRAARAKTPRSEADKMKIAELEAREDVRVPLTVHWNRAGQVGDDRPRRQHDPPGRAPVEQVDQPRLQHQHARARARHGAALSDRRRPGTAAVRLAGELAAGQSAGADVVARLVRRRHLRAARPVPHARLGRGDVAAERRPHRREDVHGGSLPRVRRPRAGDPAADRLRSSGICSSASSNRPIASST